MRSLGAGLWESPAAPPGRGALRSSAEQRGAPTGAAPASQPLSGSAGGASGATNNSREVVKGTRIEEPSSPGLT